MIDISLLCPEQYTLEELASEELILEKFVSVEADGHLSVEDLSIQQRKNVNKLFAFLFDGQSELPKLFDGNGLSIYDLSKVKEKIISFQTLEARYTDWIIQSGYENTMDEYGMLIGVVGFIRRNQLRKNLLAVVRERT